MEETKRINYIKDVLENMPTDWLNLTTHQLDIYNEKLAKTQFLDQFETLFNTIILRLLRLVSYQLRTTTFD